MHLCITPQNYQPIKAECLLLSHYMEIRSHSKSVSREGGEERRKSQSQRETDERGAAAAAALNAPLRKQERRSAAINKMILDHNSVTDNKDAKVSLANAAYVLCPTRENTWANISFTPRLLAMNEYTDAHKDLLNTGTMEAK